MYDLQGQNQKFYPLCRKIRGRENPYSSMFLTSEFLVVMHYSVYDNIIISHSDLMKHFKIASGLTEKILIVFLLLLS